MIKITLYRTTTIYPTKEEAEKFLLECMAGSEGAEQARYTEAYLQLMEGLTEVGDGE